MGSAEHAYASRESPGRHRRNARRDSPELRSRSSKSSAWWAIDDYAPPENDASTGTGSKAVPRISRWGTANQRSSTVA